MKTILHWLVLIFLFVAAASPSRADIMLLEIRSPKDCPEGLVITSKAKNGLTEFAVEVDPETVTHVDALYKGRVSANAVLDVAMAGEKVAFAALQGTTEGKMTRYHFSVSAPAAKTSQLQVGLSLREKDGMPTLGGGVSVRVHLAGFEPKPEVERKVK